MSTSTPPIALMDDEPPIAHCPSERTMPQRARCSLSSLAAAQPECNTVAPQRPLRNFVQEPGRRGRYHGSLMKQLIEQPRESVRRVLGGAVEMRRFRGIDQPFAPHVHDYPVIGLMRRGQRLMTCGQARYELASGQLLALNPEQPHGCVPCGEESLVYDSLALLHWPDCPALEGPAVTDRTAAARFAGLIAQLEAPVIDEAAAEEQLTLLLCRLARVSEPAARPGAAQAMASYLQSHRADAVRLSDLAAVAATSRYGALRAFQASFGITPMRYLAALRAETARRALAAGARCADAAQEAGFADQAHLTRVFKERFGITPSAYRKAVS